MEISKENLVLYLPFDEDESAKAADFSPARTGATHDGTFTTYGCSKVEDSVFGLALKMESDNITTDGDCNVTDHSIVLSTDWTMTGWVKPSTSILSFCVNYDGINTYQHHEQNVEVGNWYFVAIQHYGTKVRIVVNKDVVYDEDALGTPIGFSVVDTLYLQQDVVVDEVRIYNRALTLIEMYTLQQPTDDVEYSVDGTNFKLFGVEVSKADGLFDGLARKSPLEVDWSNYHGKVVDLSRTRYQSRTITLECFLVASDNFAFVRWVKKFIEAFQKDGLRRLTCEYAGSVKPLAYDVYLDDSVEIDKTWNEELMVGTFTLTLIEPSPVKMVLRHTCQASGYDTLTITSSKMLDITWGDNSTSCEISTDNGTTWVSKTNSSNLRGTALKVRHNYAQAGVYDILIHGVIEDLASSAIVTTDVVVWSKL